MNKRPPRSQGKCPECGQNLYKEVHETDPLGPEDAGHQYETLECENAFCGYWRHREPDEDYIED